MRNYAQGWRSDCDDLIEQKPQCVRLHMRIFVNEDHRKMNVRPQRKFASSRVTGIYQFLANQTQLDARYLTVFSLNLLSIQNIELIDYDIALQAMFPANETSAAFLQFVENSY